MEPTVGYAEFKVVESNLRECFDICRSLTQDIRQVNAAVQMLARTTADLSRRLARLEDRPTAQPERGGI